MRFFVKLLLVLAATSFFGGCAVSMGSISSTVSTQSTENGQQAPMKCGDQECPKISRVKTYYVKSNKVPNIIKDSSIGQIPEKMLTAELSKRGLLDKENGTMYLQIETYEGEVHFNSGKANVKVYYGYIDEETGMVIKYYTLSASGKYNAEANKEYGNRRDINAMANALTKTAESYIDDLNSDMKDVVKTIKKEAEAYEEACRKDTVKAYFRFLNSYPVNLHAEEAAMKIMDKSGWFAKIKPKYEKYQMFIEKYPKMQISKILKKNKNKEHYKYALDKNNIYEVYYAITEYEMWDFREKGVRHIIEVGESEAREAALDILNDLRRKGSFSSQFSIIDDGIVRLEYANAKDAGTQEAYEHFLRKYKNAPKELKQDIAAEKENKEIDSFLLELAE
jgi:uncharacterized lipoprotein YajG